MDVSDMTKQEIRSIMYNRLASVTSEEKKSKNPVFTVNQRELEHIVKKEVEKCFKERLTNLSYQTKAMYQKETDKIHSTLNTVIETVDELNDLKTELLQRNQVVNEIIEAVMDRKQNYMNSPHLNRPMTADNLRNKHKKRFRSQSHFTGPLGRNEKINYASKLDEITAIYATQHSKSQAHNMKNKKKKTGTRSNISKTLLKKLKAEEELRPNLLKVSMMSTNTKNPSVAIRDKDLILFKIVSDRKIYPPRIKLWETIPYARRYKIDCLNVDRSQKVWLCACKLFEDAPLGNVTFVIQYDSIDHMPGQAVKVTSDKSCVRIYDMDDEDSIKSPKQLKAKKIKKKKQRKNVSSTHVAQKNSDPFNFHV